MPSLHATQLILAIGLSALWLPTKLAAQEVQHHGVFFEEWIRSQFFDGFKPASYTQKWDIPAEANPRFGRIPVNPKATRYGAPIGMGDALRQFDINEPYLLIVGFWDQVGSSKRFVNVVATRVDPELHQRLWHPVTRADLEALDTLIKERTLPVDQVRRKVQAIKTQPPFAQAIMQVNPKIDSKGQRRLQCSIRFADFFTYLAPDASSDRMENPKLFGVAVPLVPDSEPRTFTPRHPH
ncbi:MAG: hypothetical protein OHK005_13360 [Candidatus Methylacidiphilales bacterium]